MEVHLSNQTWMADNPALHTKKLRYICLPVTHDSGTCDLSEQMTPDQAEWEQLLYGFLQEVAAEISAIPDIGPYIPDPAEWLRKSLYLSARGLATATSKTIAQQLDDGIRGLDLRIYYDAATSQFYTYHGFAGTPMTEVLSQIQSFMKATTGEIVYVTCGHYQPEAGFPQSDFQTLLTNYLQDYLYVPTYTNGAIDNDPFQTVYTDIIGQGGTNKSRVILVNIASENSDYFWPVSYSPPDSDDKNTVLYGWYTNTTKSSKAISTQQTQLGTAVTNDYPFALYMTLTPNGLDYGLVIAANIGAELAELARKIAKQAPLTAASLFALGTSISTLYSWTRGWRTLLQLSQLLDADLEYVLVNDFLLPARQQGATDNPLSLIYLDWYETTDVVNLAIDLNAGKAFTWQGDKPVTFTGSPANTQANYQPQIAVLDETMYMIYPYNNDLYLATSTDPLAQTWDGGSLITCNGTTPQTNFSTAMIAWRGKIHVAFTGVRDQSTTVYYMTFDGKTWSGNTPMMGAKTVAINSQSTPSFAVYDDTLYMAFRGVGKDDAIYIMSCGPEKEEWSVPTSIPTIPGQTQQPLTQATPTLAVYDGLLWVLFIAWNGSDIWYANYDGENWAGNEQVVIASNGSIPETNYGPSAMSFNGRLWVIYKGQGSDTLYASTYTNGWKGNNSFSKFAHLSPESNYNPGLAVYQDGLVVIYKGQGSNTIYSLVYGPPNLD